MSSSSGNAGSSYVDMTSGAVEHCEVMSNLHPDLADSYGKIANHCRGKLWHQLTLCLLDFFTTPTTLRTTPEGSNSYLALFTKVVLVVEKKLNALSLARMASAVADSLLQSDATAAKAVLENLLVEKKNRLGMAATLYTEAKLHLLTLSSSGLLDKDETQQKESLNTIYECLKKNAALLQELSVDVDLVHSAHYECSMTYRKVVGPPEAFYTEALLYLNYTPFDEGDTMTMETEAAAELQALAVDVSLAALTGDGVFNFGQIVTKPIITTVLKKKSETQNNQFDWLVELLETMAMGNVQHFEQVTTQYAQEIQSQPALANRMNVVQEKITLLALVNMVFDRPSSERTLSFTDIAARIYTSNAANKEEQLNQVEWVIMRALSLHLVEGTMDQVAQEFHVTWVMPRVLTTPQIAELASRFGSWAVKVSQTKDYVTEHTQEGLFA